MILLNGQQVEIAATLVEAEAAGQYSTIHFIKESNAGWGSTVEVRTPRIQAHTKVWVRAKNATNNATLDFLVSIHEYDFLGELV